MAQELRLFTLCYPLTGDGGESKHHLAWTQEQLTRYAGGCTCLSAGNGFWGNRDGQTVQDTILPILTVAPANAESHSFFQYLTTYLADVLGQEVIFLYSTPVYMG